MRINALTSLLAINAAAVSMAGAAKLKTVEDIEHNPDDHVEGENTLQGGGGEPQIEEAKATPFKPTFTVVEDLPDDIPELRSTDDQLEWGFSDMPVNAFMYVPADLVQRARGAIQNARVDKKGEPNGKRFQTYEISKVPSAQKRNPGWKKGDIEIVRRA